jgi:hypothetical protein
MPTVQTKSVGATARDYATPALFEAAIPADIVSTDEQWIGECYNDAEFSSTSSIDFSGHTCDATRNIILRPASGEGFRQHADVLTNALRYNQSNGVGMIKTSQYGEVIFNSDSDFLELFGLQIKHTHTSNGEAFDLRTTGNRLDSSIADGNNGGRMNGGGLIVNCAITERGTGNLVFISASSGSCQIVNCTVIRASDLSSGGTGLTSQYGGNICKGNAVFGCTTGEDDAAGAWAAGSDYNATDDTAFVGGNSLNTLTFADQFENTVEATLDMRAKLGADLIDANIVHTEAGGVDIIGQTRDASTPTIGCWEFVSGAIPDIDPAFIPMGIGPSSSPTKLLLLGMSPNPVAPGELSPQLMLTGVG